MKAHQIIERRQKLYNFLISVGRTDVSIKELATTLNLSERQVYRDIEALEESVIKQSFKKLNLMKIR